MIFRICVLLFLVVTFSQLAKAEEKEISEMTCKQFVSFIGSKIDTKENWNAEVEKFWREEKNAFRKKYPDRYNKRLSSTLFDTVLHKHILLGACAYHNDSNPRRTLSSKVQNYFYYITNFKAQKIAARQNGCAISSKGANLFGLTGPSILVCHRSSPSMQIAVSRAADAEGELEGKSDEFKSIRICYDSGINDTKIYGKPGTKKQGCEYREVTRGLQCLGAYGVCQKLGDAKCGWVETPESLKCLQEEF